MQNPVDSKGIQDWSVISIKYHRPRSVDGHIVSLLGDCVAWPVFWFGPISVVTFGSHLVWRLGTSESAEYFIQFDFPQVRASQSQLEVLVGFIPLVHGEVASLSHVGGLVQQFRSNQSLILESSEKRIIELRSGRDVELKLYVVGCGPIEVVLEVDVEELGSNGEVDIVLLSHDYWECPSIEIFLGLSILNQTERIIGLQISGEPSLTQVVHLHGQASNRVLSFLYFHSPYLLTGGTIETRNGTDFGVFNFGAARVVQVLEVGSEGSCGLLNNRVVENQKIHSEGGEVELEHPVEVGVGE